jgi:hypothetical protein
LSRFAPMAARVREVTGPDIEILIDVHGRFNVPTAIRLCRTLEDAANKNVVVPDMLQNALTGRMSVAAAADNSAKLMKDLLNLA